MNRTTLFLILTFGISFSVAGLYKLFGGQYDNPVSATILALAYMFIPMICAVIVEKVIHKESLKTGLFISFKINRWFFVAWLIPPLMSFGTLGISLLFPGVSFSPEMAGMIKRFEDTIPRERLEQMKISLEILPVHPVWLALGQGLIAGVTINAVAGFGEELGWRGFLLKALKKMNFLKASLFIGLIWGIWHAPLILMGHNYPQHPEIGVLMMTVWCILLSPLFLYITIKSRSVIAAAIMHGTLNATAGIAIMVIDGGNDLTVGMTGIAGFISLGLVLLILFVYDRYLGKEKVMTNSLSRFL
ncbi:MAG: CPBP family intramembrane glutamic endopeptidase [Bacteroidales bacterium]|jgi:membrane protease YdiL (CAAX protease family)|nr:CPBP family intramembrane glutamic endopeptidase [Bacteroidales bacterium]